MGRRAGEKKNKLKREAIIANVILHKNKINIVKLPTQENTLSYTHKPTATIVQPIKVHTVYVKIDPLPNISYRMTTTITTPTPPRTPSPTPTVIRGPTNNRGRNRDNYSRVKKKKKKKCYCGV